MICIEILDPVNAVVAEFQISVNFFTISKKRISTLICPIFFNRELRRNIWFLPGNESYYSSGVPGFYLQENFELI